MKPETIVDQSIPLLEGEMSDSYGNNSNPVISDSVGIAPTTQLDKAFPPKVIAHATISETLDTESKRIKGEFTFESLGAIKIGEFSQGISGEIVVSPDGIVSTNSNGDTTFTLDGATGDATFRGTVEAGNFVIADENGILSLNNFTSNNTIQTGSNQVISGTSFVDVTNSSYQLVLERTVTVLFLYSVDWYLTESVGNTGDGLMELNIDGTDRSQLILRNGNNSGLTSTGYSLIQLTAGTHTIKLRGKLERTTGFPSMTVIGFKSSYLTLGT